MSKEMSERDKSIAAAEKRNKVEKIKGIMTWFLMIFIFCLFFILISLFMGNSKTVIQSESLGKVSMDELNMLGPEELSKTLTERGYVLYALPEGECDACFYQKGIFDDYVDNLNIVQCEEDMSDEDEWIICLQITQYPSWRLPDGKYIAGYQSLDVLNVIVNECNQTGCTMDNIGEVI